VQDFQPIYLLARRKEKPLLARTIVLIIRKRGGRFLKKDDETGELYEVGDAKAEAKTSQALREGLDVRATKSAASSLMDKKKKKSSNTALADATSSPNSPSTGSHGATEEGGSSPSSASDEKKDESMASPNSAATEPQKNPAPSKDRAESPPTLPRLHGDQSDNNKTSPTNAPPSPEQMQFRKRRRMRSADGDVTTVGCGVNPFSGDKLFPDFCPPRADLARTASPVPRGMGGMDMSGMTPIGARAGRYHEDDDDDIRYEEADATEQSNASGCAGIALDMMTGAAAGSFCLGPRQWR
jgi:hypothetical protein